MQCNGESEASSWSCQAQAELRVINQKNPQDNFVRKIGHLFYAKENDWGFSHYLSWNDVCDPEKGYITEDGSVTFQVKVQLAKKQQKYIKISLSFRSTLYSYLCAIPGR